MLRAMPAPMFPSPMNPTRMARLLLGEDFLEEDGGARGRIGADQLLLLAHHVEESVEGLTRDVVVEIGALGFREGNGIELSHQSLVLPTSLMLLSMTGRKAAVSWSVVSALK